MQGNPENFCFNWNPRKFCFWYPESWVLETGIQSKDWEFRIQVPLTKTGIQCLESGIHGVECKIQDRLGFLYMGQYTSLSIEMHSLRKQLTFGDASTGFPAKRRLRNECRNNILMACHKPDLGSVSDWLNQISHAARPKYCLDLGSDTLSVWNFCARFSDSIWWGNQW